MSSKATATAQLITDQTLTSAVGAWKARLADVHHRLEAIGGVRIAATSRRCAQLATFLWFVHSSSLSSNGY